MECLAVVVYPEGAGVEDEDLAYEVSSDMSSLWTHADRSATTLNALINTLPGV